ncbi:hypothetical protein [Streptomyces sp. NPDC050564]|uniref:hypothetical protein n=1 Tax=Streptomyces sp. NPDC050564 TaxID=3365631 RepID=UPI0037ADC115
MSARAVAEAAGAGSLVESLAAQFQFTYSFEAGASEKRSWGNSLPALAHTLLDAGLGDVEVLIEYPVPRSSYRVDALLTGAYPVTGEPSYVVVELKQWTAVEPVPDAEDLVTVQGMGNTARLHPVAQVRRYCDHIADFTKSLQRPFYLFSPPMEDPHVLHRLVKRHVLGPCTLVLASEHAPPCARACPRSGVRRPARAGSDCRPSPGSSTWRPRARPGC